MTKAQSPAAPVCAASAAAMDGSSVAAGEIRARSPAAEGSGVAGGAEQAQFGWPVQAGGGVHYLPGDVGAALDEVVYRVGHEQVAVGVQGGAQLGEGGGLCRSEGDRQLLLGKDCHPVADASAG